MKKLYYIGQQLDSGRTHYRVLYLFDIATPILDHNGTAVVAYSSAAIPPWATDEVLSAEKASIDAGLVGFVEVTADQTGGELGPAFVTRVKADYDVVVAWELARMTEKWAETGSGLRTRGSQSW